MRRDTFKQSAISIIIWAGLNPKTVFYRRNYEAAGRKFCAALFLSLTNQICRNAGGAMIFLKIFLFI
jgi:hypothetical protein